MKRPRWSLRARARLALGDMERIPGLSLRQACMAAHIDQSSFYRLIQRPKHEDLKDRFNAIRAKQPARRPYWSFCK